MKLELVQKTSLSMKIPSFLYLIILSVSIYTFSACHRKTVPSGSTSSQGNTYKNDNNTSNSTGVDFANMQQDILFYINKYRKSKGLRELQLLNIASAEAAKHSANMAAKRTPFGHTGFEARASAISRSLGETVSAIAENVADGKLTAQQVVDGWLHSPGHKKNIEGGYTLTGIGVAKDAGGVIYFTQIFLRK